MVTTKQKSEIVDQVSEDFSNDDIAIRDYDIIEAFALETDKEQALDKLQRKISFNANLKLKFGIKTCTGFNSSSRTTEETNEVVYAGTFLHTAKFSFKTTPNLKENIPQSAWGILLCILDMPMLGIQSCLSYLINPIPIKTITIQREEYRLISLK